MTHFFFRAPRFIFAGGIVVCLLAVTLRVAAETAPAAMAEARISPPSPASATSASAPARSTAPATAATKPADNPLGTTTVHLVEDPNLRIWGTFSPRQMLHLGVTAIVIFNAVGWAILIYIIMRGKRRHAQRHAKDSTPTGN